MTADVEIARDFLHSKAASKSTTIVVLKSVLCHFKLFSLIWLPKQLEIPRINILPFGVQSVLLD